MTKTTITDSVSADSVSADGASPTSIEIINEFHGPFRFLSNFWMVPINYKGSVYPTSEHAFQSQKTLDENDWDRINFVRWAEITDDGQVMVRCRPTTPGESKRAAGPKAEFPINLRPDWDAVSLPEMEAILWVKFNVPAMRQKLLGTGNAILIEGNFWHDTRWGVCLCPQHKGEGSNLLGQAIMAVRDRLHQT